MFTFLYNIRSTKYNIVYKIALGFQNFQRTSSEDEYFDQKSLIATRKWLQMELFLEFKFKSSVIKTMIFNLKALRIAPLRNKGKIAENVFVIRFNQIISHSSKSWKTWIFLLHFFKIIFQFPFTKPKSKIYVSNKAKALLN